MYKPTVHSPRAVPFHEESAGGTRPHLPVTGVLYFTLLQIIIVQLPIVEFPIIILLVFLLGGLQGLLVFHTVNACSPLVPRSSFSLLLIILGASLLGLVLLPSRGRLLRDLLIIV